jgi:glycerol kinase
LIQFILQVIQSVSDSEAVATSVPDNGGVYFVPAFSGLYAPYWRSDARGLIIGLTAFNTRAHLIRAALEASAFQAREVIEAMERDFGLSIPRLNVDGGMTANNFLMQVPYAHLYGF